MAIRQKITPFLWFDSNAEEAIALYVSLFPNSRITNVLRHGEGDPGPDDRVIGFRFELDGQTFGAINGGPTFQLSEAMSLYVGCDTQEEIDRLWAALSEGGKTQACGWLKDRFGLSWQINYSRYFDLVADPDPARGRRVMDALFAMTKVDIATLERAYAGK